MTFFYCLILSLLSIRDFSMVLSIDSAYISILIYAILPVLLLVDISHNHFSMKKEILPIYAILLLSIFHINTAYLCFTLLFVYLFREENIFKGFVVIFVTRGICTLFLLLFLKAGIISDTIWGYKGERALHLLGMAENPNTVSFIFFPLIMSLFVFFACRRSCLILSLFILAVYLVYEYTGSRTFFISEVFALFLYFVLKHRKIKRFAILLPYLLFFTSFLIMILFAGAMSPMMTIVDAFLSFRPRFYGMVFESMRPINFIIGMKLPEEITLDSSYIHILLCGGIFFIWYLLHEYALFMKKIYAFDYKRLNAYITFVLVIALAGNFETVFSMLRDISILFYLIIYKVINLDVKNMTLKKL